MTSLAAAAIHPKTGGAAFGGTVGVLITAILSSFHGVHLSSELPAAISAFCAALGAFLVPASASQTDVEPKPLSDPMQQEITGIVNVLMELKKSVEQFSSNTPPAAVSTFEPEGNPTGRVMT